MRKLTKLRRTISAWAGSSSTRRIITGSPLMEVRFPLLAVYHAHFPANCSSKIFLTDRATITLRLRLQNDSISPRAQVITIIQRVLCSHDWARRMSRSLAPFALVPPVLISRETNHIDGGKPFRRRIAGRRQLARGHHNLNVMLREAGQLRRGRDRKAWWPNSAKLVKSSTRFGK